MKLHMRSLAYASTSLASSMMNSLFFFYYVKLFLDKYHVSQAWFHSAQMVYMVWNAINDPLFAYFQDNSDMAIFRERRKSIFYGGPAYAMCFLLPWFAWGDYQTNSWLSGAHLMFTLCAYDSVLTFVLLAQCAMFAEMSRTTEDRLRLIKYQQVASLLGSSSVFISSFVSNNMECFQNLQILCIAIALFAWFCMRYTGTQLQINNQSSGDENSMLPKPNLENEQKSNLGMKDALKITSQILRNKNFLAFVFMNFFQVFHVSFVKGFLNIFADHLIPSDQLSTTLRSILYGTSYALPQAMVILGGSTIRKFGSYRIIWSSFVIQCFMSFIMFVTGRRNYTMLVIYFILDMTIPSAVISLNNMTMSDIIDQDRILYKNRRSAMIFGINALITKPAKSLSPMLVVSVLDWFGYNTLKEISDSKISNTSKQNLNGEVDKHELLLDSMFVILCVLPISVSLTQFVIWSRYRLRNEQKQDENI